jgi:chromosome partitioning protein
MMPANKNQLIPLRIEAMKTITLINEKGGVGKTTLATHVAAGLAIRGMRVVLADADPQGHASVSLGIRKDPGLYDLLVRGAAFKEVLRPVTPECYYPPGYPIKGQLYVVPSNVETRSIPIQISDAFAVVDRFRELEGYVDAVVFDTSPTPSLLHGSIYMATDSIIYPTKCEFLSFDGLRESLAHREGIQPTRARWGLSEIQVMGIVPTMFRSGTLVHQENLNKLKAKYGNLVWPEMAMRTLWAESSSVGQLVYRFAPDSGAARDAWNIVDRVETEMRA